MVGAFVVIGSVVTALLECSSLLRRRHRCTVGAFVAALSSQLSHSCPTTDAFVVMPPLRCSVDTVVVTTSPYMYRWSIIRCSVVVAVSLHIHRHAVVVAVPFAPSSSSLHCWSVLLAPLSSSLYHQHVRYRSIAIAVPLAHSSLFRHRRLFIVAISLKRSSSLMNLRYTAQVFVDVT